MKVWLMLLFMLVMILLLPMLGCEDDQPSHVMPSYGDDGNDNSNNNDDDDDDDDNGSLEELGEDDGIVNLDDETETKKFGDECRAAIPVIFRDFNQDHPDFEAYGGNIITTGLVEDILGDDRKPQFKSSAGDANQRTVITSKKSFDTWYNSDDDINFTFKKTLVLKENDEGNLVYKDSTFFPIPADEGYGAEFEDYPDKNFLFTTEVHMKFTYRQGQEFSFTGDDDMWIFIGSRLALDLGGMHTQVSGTIYLDEVAEKYGLEEGKQYNMEIFHAERATEESNFHIETNIECFESVVI